MPHIKERYTPTFAVKGAVSVTTGTLRWYNDTFRTLTLERVRASVGTQPTGAALIIDVNLNGTSIWATTPANRTQIAASTSTGASDTFDTVSVPAGGYLTVDIDQVGSTVAGSDLTVQITMKG